MTPLEPAVDTFDIRRARRLDGVLREFNDAGVLTAADVHVARRLSELASERDPTVTLAAALAVRGPRLGHVYVDLETVHETAAVDVEDPVDLSLLAWPPALTWRDQLIQSPLVAVGDDDTSSNRPLRLLGSRVYLDRYWRQERRLAADLRSLSEAPVEDVRPELLNEGLDRLFPGQTDSAQALAAAAAVLQRFAVVAGGPGTGKTTTVARIAALLVEQFEAAGSHPPLVALAAPTGKASARLEEAAHEEASRLATAESIRAQLLGLGASTLHRLLGWRPGNRSRFRHDRRNRLPHDVVIVDEASMVSLSLMASLVEAVRPAARLVLMGDPGQLTSIEAGAVLGDIVGPVIDGLRMSEAARSRLAEATGHQVAAIEPPVGATVGDGIVALDRVHRFGAGIGSLASAIRGGDAEAVLDLLADPPDDVTWIPVDVGEHPTHPDLGPVRKGIVATARTVTEMAREGAAAEAIGALGRFRALCAHRRGDYGVATWMTRIEGWLTEAIEEFGAEGGWYVGRPLLVTENDYSLRLYNGDTGVIVARGQGVAAAFDRGEDVLEVRPSRLESVETAYAMTIHKSQGSQFDTASVLLPNPASRILTRELLYTAVTRARRQLILVGTNGSIRAAVARPASRASGLRERLWQVNPSGSASG
jgi:exodeoxyribonuclease V alpha subunit